MQFLEVGVSGVPKYSDGVVEVIQVMQVANLPIQHTKFVQAIQAMLIINKVSSKQITFSEILDIFGKAHNPSKPAGCGCGNTV